MIATDYIRKCIVTVKSWISGFVQRSTQKISIKKFWKPKTKQKISSFLLEIKDTKTGEYLLFSPRNITFFRMVLVNTKPMYKIYFVGGGDVTVHMDFGQNIIHILKNKVNLTTTFVITDGNIQEVGKRNT